MDFDLLIVGGGPVASAAALAARALGWRMGLLAGREPLGAPRDRRPIALSHGSRLMLERLEVWGRLQPATPIEHVHVSQRGGFGRTQLDAAQASLPALGYVVEYDRLARVLSHALEQSGCCSVIVAPAESIEGRADAACATYDTGAGPAMVRARLLAVADGGAMPRALARSRDYRQCAVTASVSTDRPHRNWAYERFTPEGPLALLPTGDSLALIWATTPEQAGVLCEMPAAAFLHRLQQAFGGRLGRFLSVDDRASFPVSLKVARKPGEPRVVALGNAAQTLHPVAGQGFNLGLRDAVELADTLQGLKPAAIGSAAHLDRYEARRRLDRAASICITDFLVRLFSNDVDPLRVARGIALSTLGAVPPARDFLLRRMTFGARG